MKRLLLLLLLLASPAFAAEKLDLTGAVQTLDSTFRGMPAWPKGITQLGNAAPMKPLSDPGFRWTPGYIWNHPIVGNKTPMGTAAAAAFFPAFSSNNDADADPNGDMLAQMAVGDRPFWFDNGSGLCFIATPMPANLKKLVSPADAPATHKGASIISYPYAQRYGVFSMVAQIPKGKGIKPAFWMLPYDLSWPPELDVVEVLGADPKTAYFTVHLPNAPQIGNLAKLPFDLSDGYHEYTVDWGPKLVKFYIDRVLYWATATPASLNKPMYLIVNLAVPRADRWGGGAPANVYAIMRVKSVKAWQRPEYVEAK